ncbi:MAG: hypothetical protein P0S95_06975 [Rhabdochlamydiaceae bacterium]|nr:hypothetical protein [Candidatus Amphrikana amoebophyrae]
MNIVLKTLSLSFCLGAMTAATPSFASSYTRQLFEEPFYSINEIDSNYEGRFCIKTKEGCCWEVKPQSRQRVREDWRADDRVVILPKPGYVWFSERKDYCLKNKETQTIAFVSMYKAGKLHEEII